VQPGLEVRLAVDGSGLRTARIPPSWRLLVLAEPPAEESCRIDVARHMPLSEVRGTLASTWRRPPYCVEALFLDGAPLAGGRAGDAAWAKTVEEALIFGHRMTCTLSEPKPGLWEELSAELEAIEAAVSQVEAALTATQVTAGQAHSQLAQLEAKLERLQCRGVDAADAAELGCGDREEGRARRKAITHRVELLSARLNGLFVGLGAAKAAAASAAPARIAAGASGEEVATEASPMPLQPTVAMGQQPRANGARPGVGAAAGSAAGKPAPAQPRLQQQRSCGGTQGASAPMDQCVVT